MTTRSRKVKIDRWWLDWLIRNATETPLKYDDSGVPFIQQGALRTLQALERLLLEHGVEAPFEIDLPRKKTTKDE